MAGIDKAAIAFSIAIVAVGVGFAFYMGTVQDAGPVVSAPVSKTETKAVETKTQTDPFADIADKVKAAPVEEKPVMKQEQKQEMKQEHVEEMKTEETVKEGPKTVSVDIPSGTSTPGCEESDMCFDPASVTINVGDTVEWKNVDTAAHTVTGGSPADGPSGVFDSSLVMGGASFAHTFDKAGSYDYFCMVHPWMVGNVQVN